MNRAMASAVNTMVRWASIVSRCRWIMDLAWQVAFAHLERLLDLPEVVITQRTSEPRMKRPGFRSVANRIEVAVVRAERGVDKKPSRDANVGDVHDPELVRSERGEVPPSAAARPVEDTRSTSVPCYR